MRQLAPIVALMFTAAVGCAPVGPGDGPSPLPAAAAFGSQAAETPPPGPERPEDPATEGSGGWTLPEPALGYNARQGQSLFRHYCATCHGDEGHGDGFNTYTLDLKPRDLADPEFQAKRSDKELVDVIRSGGGAAGLSTGMPPWGRTLGERDIRNLVTYLRSLPPAPD